MSAAYRRKLGQCLGGIKTLEDIRIRCSVDEDEGCLVWPGAMSGREAESSELPTAFYNGSYRSLVRVVWELSNKPLDLGQIVWRTCCNKDKRCLEPTHMMCGTRKEHGAWVKATGVRKGLITHLTANRAIGRARRKLTEQDVVHIQVSDESVEALAKKYGMTTHSIYRVRRQQQLVKNASVFNWRPA